MRSFLKEMRKARKVVVLLLGGAAQHTRSAGTVERVGWRSVEIKGDDGTRYVLALRHVIFACEQKAERKT